MSEKEKQRLMKNLQYSLTQKEVMDMSNNFMSGGLGRCCTTADLVRDVFDLAIKKASLVCDHRANGLTDPSAILEARKCAAAIRHFCGELGEAPKDIKIGDIIEFRGDIYRVTSKGDSPNTFDIVRHPDEMDGDRFRNVRLHPRKNFHYA